MRRLAPIFAPARPNSSSNCLPTVLRNQLELRNNLTASLVIMSIVKSVLATGGTPGARAAVVARQGASNGLTGISGAQRPAQGGSSAIVARAEGSIALGEGLKNNR